MVYKNIVSYSLPFISVKQLYLLLFDHSALCTLHSALCTLHSALCTLHSALYTLLCLRCFLSSVFVSVGKGILFSKSLAYGAYGGLGSELESGHINYDAYY
jgi:hypothetical protein